MKNQNFRRMMIHMELSDIIFDQHMESEFGLNKFIILIQTLLMVFGLICGLFGITVSPITAGIIIVLCGIVMLNNAINQKAWKRAKERLTKAEALIDVFGSDYDDDLKDKLFYDILGVNVPDKEKLEVQKAELEDELEILDYILKLRARWQYNFELREPTGFKDKKGEEYKTGDIAFNPLWGDFWFVEKLSEEERSEFGFETNYCLSLYGNKEESALELDEPDGFEIVIRPTDKDYNKTFDDFEKIFRDHRLQDKKWEKEAEENKNKEVKEKTEEENTEEKA